MGVAAESQVVSDGRKELSVDIDVDVGTADGAIVADVRGEVTLASTPALRRQLLDLVTGSSERLTVKLARVTRMDSSVPS